MKTDSEVSGHAFLRGVTATEEERWKLRADLALIIGMLERVRNLGMHKFPVTQFDHHAETAQAALVRAFNELAP